MTHQKLYLMLVCLIAYQELRPFDQGIVDTQQHQLARKTESAIKIQKAFREYADREKEAGLLDRDTVKIMDRLKSLDTLIKKTINHINGLFDRVLQNPTKYSLEFISELERKFEPDYTAITQKLDQTSDQADVVLDILIRAHNQMDVVAVKMLQIHQQEGKSKFNLIQEMKTLRAKFDRNAVLMSDILTNFEKHTTELSLLYDALEAAEKSILIIHFEKIGRALELGRAVWLQNSELITQAQQKRESEKAQQQDMIARVLELAYQVRLK